MAQGNRSSFFMGLSALFYLVLLFSPLALVSQVNAQDSQDPLQENYGTGE
jgi:heat shock protein 5